MTERTRDALATAAALILGLLCLYVMLWLIALIEGQTGWVV